MKPQNENSLELGSLTGLVNTNMIDAASSPPLAWPKATGLKTARETLNRALPLQKS